MLVLTVPQASQLEGYNCLALDLPDGSRVRLWLTRTARKGVRVVIDAPRPVVVTRGKLLGEAAAHREADR